MNSSTNSTAENGRQQPQGDEDQHVAVGYQVPAMAGQVHRHGPGERHGRHERGRQGRQDARDNAVEEKQQQREIGRENGHQRDDGAQQGIHIAAGGDYRQGGGRIVVGDYQQPDDRNDEQPDG